jgi:hypothetical protein
MAIVGDDQNPFGRGRKVTTWNYECFDCRRVFFALTEKPEKCPRCAKAGGQLVSDDRLEKNFEAGTYYNIDPATGICHTAARQLAGV